MNALITMAQAFGRFTDRIGRVGYGLAFVAVLASAANATVRYTPSVSPGAWLEIQWYLFSAVFLFCARWALMASHQGSEQGGSHRLSRRAQSLLEILGIVSLLLLSIALVTWLLGPVLTEAYQHGQLSFDDAEIVVWPARVLVPLGFGALLLQGIFELIKRVALLVSRPRRVPKQVSEQGFLLVLWILKQPRRPGI